MIDEKIERAYQVGFAVGQNLLPSDEIVEELLTETKTAIYEIGLECIGADEVAPQSETGIDLGSITGTNQRNDLRASQRKAWAKACGVAEK